MFVILQKNNSNQAKLSGLYFQLKTFLYSSFIPTTITQPFLKLDLENLYGHSP